LNFYLSLGFTPVFAYGSPEFTKQFSFPTAPEKYQGVSFAVGDAIFEIADGHIAVKQEVFGEMVQSSKISMFFDIDSVDEFVKVCQKCDIKIVVEPKAYPWGTKEVVVKDPDGTVLVFREKAY
jgi:uncharacterized glyoxalase superfamily protein PhnB